MPGAGLATVREIGARLPEAKLVVLTVSGKDSDLFVALPTGVHGYLLKTMDLDRLPDMLTGVCFTEAAMPRTLVAHVLESFRQRGPRWRQTVSTGPTPRLTRREWVS